MFDRLPAHCRRGLPGRMLEVSYESLVAEQEPTTRTSLAFCGLPWEAQCPDFHTNAASIATAISAHVRAPPGRSDDTVRRDGRTVRRLVSQ